MSAREDISGMLENWEFKAAWECYQELPSGDRHDEEAAALVGTLAALLGDSGWFEGPLGDVIDAAVDYLLTGFEDETEEVGEEAEAERTP